MSAAALSQEAGWWRQERKTELCISVDAAIRNEPTFACSAQAVLDPGEDLMDDASLEKREAEASQRSARSSKRSGPARGRTFAARLRAMRSPSSKRVAPEA